MTEIVHILFFSIVLMICLFIIKKSRATNKRRWYLVSLIIAFILLCLSGLVPVENAFVTFSSPESAFRYTNSGDVSLVVEGEESALVVGTEDYDFICDFIPKSDDGWKLGSGNVEKISFGLSPHYVGFDVYQYKDSEDYYVMVSDSKGVTIDVTDNRNSKFYQADNASDEPYYIYYAYVHDLDDEYTLIVNGERISVLDEQN